MFTVSNGFYMYSCRAVLDIFNPESFIYANAIQAADSDLELADPLENLELVVDHVRASDLHCFLLRFPAGH